MRFVSTMALGLMLSIGGAAVVGVSPAIAAKKEKAPGQDFSNAFREVAANLQKSVQSKDFEAAKTQLAAAESAASTPDDKFLLGQFRLQIGLGLKDEAMQPAGGEGLLASGATPAGADAKNHFYGGQLAMTETKATH